MPDIPAARSLRELLEEAYRVKLAEACAHMKTWTELPLTQRPLASDWAKQNPAVRQAIQLEGWLRPEDDLQEERQRRADRLTTFFDNVVGSPYEMTAMFRRSILTRRKGAPIKPSTRRLAIAALEAQRADEKFTWMRFALSNCTCGRTPHTSRCSERIRVAAIALQKLVREVGITF